MIRALTPEELTDLMTDGTDAGFGALATEKGCLPLRALDVDVQIDGLSASTMVRQEFINVFDGPLEATYIFPLPPRAAVIGFRIVVDSGEIRGRIDERGQARHDYATAVAEGRHAAILEEERPDVFTLRVGNIPPRSAARVEFTLVAPLTIDSLEATYRFPLVVAPRYCPGEMLHGDQAGDGIALDTDLVPEASRISPPILLPGMKSPVRLGIAVRIAPGAVTSGSADAIGCSLPVSDAPGNGTFSLSIVPPASAVVRGTPRDVVFLLDRSGSMEGWQMVAGRRRGPGRHEARAGHRGGAGPVRIARPAVSGRRGPQPLCGARDRRPGGQRGPGAANADEEPR